MSGAFEGKTVLVTGGGKGIGKGIALAFAKEGANVAIGCNANPGMAEETLKELQELTEAILIPSDLSKPEGCRYVIEETVRAFGGLDILISNAAMQTQHSILESSRDIFKYVLNVNLRSAVFVMKYAHPYLKASAAGRIVLISSVHGVRPTDFDAAYATSKGGMEMLCREAALEFAADGITVNTIAPGGVIIEGKTGNPKPPTVKPKQRKKQYWQSLTGRRGLPADSAATACFLASEGAEHITGTTIHVDGGLLSL